MLTAGTISGGCFLRGRGWLSRADHRGVRFTLGEYDGVVTRTAKRRVTEVRLTPAEKPEPKKEEDEKPHFNRLTNK